MTFRKTRRNKQKAGSGQLGRFQYIADFTNDIDSSVLKKEKIEIINYITRLTQILGIIDARLNTHPTPTPSAPLPPLSSTESLSGNESLAADAMTNRIHNSALREMHAQQELMDAIEAERTKNDAAFAAALASDDNQSHSLSDSLMAADIAINEMPSTRSPVAFSNSLTPMSPSTASLSDMNWSVSSRYGGRKRKHTRKKRRKSNARNKSRR
tara:strand:+ start:4418 stop:5053 length:636 start_codon:yes stop_codon:yes gene_type:complete